MKKNILIATIALMCAGSAITAQIKFGVTTGVHLNDPKISGISGVNQYIKPFVGTSLGAFAEYPLGNNWSMQSGLQYSTRGFSMDEGTTIDVFGMNIPVGIRLNTKIHSMEFPLLLRYQLGDGKMRGFAQAGTLYSYALNGEIEPVANLILDFNLPSIDINFSDDFYSRSGWTAQFGAGIEYDVSSNGAIRGSVNYSQGLTNMLNNPIIDLQIKNKALSLGLSYAMFF